MFSSCRRDSAISGESRHASIFSVEASVVTVAPCQPLRRVFSPRGDAGVLLLGFPPVDGLPVRAEADFPACMDNTDACVRFPPTDQACTGHGYLCRICPTAAERLSCLRFQRHLRFHLVRAAAQSIHAFRNRTTASVAVPQPGDGYGIESVAKAGHGLSVVEHHTGGKVLPHGVLQLPQPLEVTAGHR